jgi:alpha-aminoadipate/glutamate carrier protein LysW
MAECPECGGTITVPKGTETNEIIQCEECGSDLEVTGTDTVQIAPEEEEDWGQ